jgi:probable F420-dependent oxidoreductase
MQIGVCLPNFSRLGTREATIEVARQAEALGYDSLWTTDHVMMTKGQDEPYGHILEALTTLTFVAALTERIRLGVSVLVFPPRNAVLVAKETATLDVLSGGRLILGLGAGWNEREFQYLGAGFADRGKRFDEYIKALKELWTADQPTFNGQWVQFSDVLFSPKPVQVGGPPIVIGGYSKPTFRRSATLADGWHATGPSPADFAEGMRQINALAGGREVLGSLRIRVGIDRRLPPQRSASGSVQSPLDGSPAEIVDRIAEYRAAGASELVLYFPTDQVDDYVGQMRRFAAEIRPRVAD